MDLHWYAIKVFWRRTARIAEALDELGIEYYAQNVVPSYMFIHTDEKTALRFRDSQFGYLYLYAERGEGKKPIVVPDRQLEAFRIITSAGVDGLEILPNDPSSYAVGDLVRVTDGPFKGAQGYVRRIRKDRRLVIVVSGVAAIATCYVPQELLEKVPPDCSEYPEK